MASLCAKCQTEILNAEFIECDGACCSKFHTKCVAINKTTFNAITSCPNIYWYCHSCIEVKNSQNVTNIKDDMNEMMKSLTNCLMTGFAMMTEKIVENVSSRTCVTVNSTNDSSRKRRRDDDDNATPVAARRRFIGRSNDKNSSCAVANADDIPQGESRKSLVVWNIDKNISSDHIVDYLAGVLEIVKESIRVTPLTPSGRNINDLTFMQYRVSVPTSIYHRALSGTTWPKGVRVREFWYSKRNTVATLDNFLVKTASPDPPGSQIITESISPSRVDVATPVVPAIPEQMDSSSVSTIN